MLPTSFTRSNPYAGGRMVRAYTMRFMEDLACKKRRLIRLSGSRKLLAKKNSSGVAPSAVPNHGEEVAASALQLLNPSPWRLSLLWTGSHALHAPHAG